MIIVVSLLSFLLVSSTGLVQQKQKIPKDNVKAVRTISGTTIGFEIGDYQHVQIRTTKGPQKSFFLGKPGLDYFLAAHKWRTVVFTYQIVDSYIPESGGVMRIERLISARVGSQAFEQWWRQLNQKYSTEEIDRRYSSLVKKYELQVTP